MDLVHSERFFVLLMGEDETVLLIDLNMVNNHIFLTVLTKRPLYGSQKCFSRHDHPSHLIYHTFKNGGVTVLHKDVKIDDQSLMKL